MHIVRPECLHDDDTDIDSQNIQEHDGNGNEATAMMRMMMMAIMTMMMMAMMTLTMMTMMISMVMTMKVTSVSGLLSGAIRYLAKPVLLPHSRATDSDN